MIKRICRIGAAHRKRRTLNKIRREFESYGHRLDGIPDARIEAALNRGDSELNAASLSAKPIYLALRRLSLGEPHRHMRKTRSGSDVGNIDFV